MIADLMEEWFVDRACDGFVLVPPYFPAAFDEFIDQVVKASADMDLTKKAAGELIDGMFGIVGKAIKKDGRFSARVRADHAPVRAIH